MKKLLWVIVLPFLIISCAAPIQNLTKTQYLNPVFTTNELQHGGLALLPITAGQGQEGYRRPLGDFLNQDLQNAVPGGKVLNWQATMDLLNQNSKVSVYEDMILAYRQTSIINREKVKDLFEALGVRYALFCSLQDYSESSQTSYNFFTGLSTSKTANVLAHCLVIDLKNGDIMQEINGQATSTAGEYMHNQAYEEYAKVMANSILSQLPGSDVPPIKKD